MNINPEKNQSTENAKFRDENGRLMRELLDSRRKQPGYCDRCGGSLTGNGSSVIGGLCAYCWDAN